MPNIGMPELLIILVIVVLLFGTRKLPELGKGLGSGIRNFKNSMKDGEKQSEIEARQAEQLTDGAERSATAVKTPTSANSNP
ncbi:MAG: twin-arginine translocase TatA/TatE family subunit [Blastocatellia bacterium]|jgi:sec-independent protein translocase protein TatA|nr:twin-arginine translocase TatA/TatE family subunit [Blastocatellia bacterium]